MKPEFQTKYEEIFGHPCTDQSPIFDLAEKFEMADERMKKQIEELVAILATNYQECEFMLIELGGWTPLTPIKEQLLIKLATLSERQLAQAFHALPAGSSGRHEIATNFLKSQNHTFDDLAKLLGPDAPIFDLASIAHAYTDFDTVLQMAETNTNSGRHQENMMTLFEYVIQNHSSSLLLRLCQKSKKAHDNTLIFLSNIRLN